MCFNLAIPENDKKASRTNTGAAYVRLNSGTGYPIYPTTCLRSHGFLLAWWNLVNIFILK